MESTHDEKSCIEAGILDNALVMIAVLGEKGRVVSWNHAAETITGYLQKDVIGSNAIWKDLYPDKDYRKSITQKIADVFTTKNYFENLETTILTKNRDRRIISWNTRQIGSAGIYHEIAIGRDITEQRKAEESLVAYMTEMSMRLKQPVEIISNTLRESAQLMKEGMLTPDEIITVLEGQARNATQIAANIQEFQTAIVEQNRSIPETYRKFLEG
ncbi:MAG: PAS domain S-box protein [Methanoregula sp.]|jgi:PAS domain S-box-containing protein